MFGGRSNKIRTAANQAFDAIEALCHPYMLSGALVDIVKSDPYVTGFLGTRIPSICVLASLEQGLDQNDTREVIAEVLLKVYGNTSTYSEINGIAKTLHESGNQRFQLGCERGKKFMNYVQHKEDITADPDFSEAMDTARNMGMSASDDMAVPLAGLDRLWFGSYMEQYL